jgi:hypothetical protein
LKEKFRLWRRMLVNEMGCDKGGGVGLPGVLLFDVLDGAATLNTTDSETRRIGEAANNPCLPLQRAGNRLVDCGRVRQVHHQDVALRRCDDEQLVLDVHAVDALRALQRTDWLRALQVPVLDCLVPGAGCDVVFTRGLEPAHAFDAGFVRFGLLGGDGAAGGRGAEVDYVEHAGAVACGYACAVLLQVSFLYLMSVVSSKRRTFDHPRPRTWPWHSNIHLPCAPLLPTS